MLGLESKSPLPELGPQSQVTHAPHSPQQPRAPGQIWLDGDVILCACPDCSAPMSVRFWLMLADCWRCGASIELSEEQERQVQQLLAERERQQQAAASAPPAPPRPAASRAAAAAQPASASTAAAATRFDSRCAPDRRRPLPSGFAALGGRTCRAASCSAAAAAIHRSAAGGSKPPSGSARLCAASRGSGTCSTRRPPG